jgi:uncharacterized membrane protein
MTSPEQTPNDSASDQTGKWLEPGHQNVQLVYILYFVGFVIGISALVGLVMAYLNRGKAGGYIESHYTWLIRTFWIGLLYMLVSIALSFVIIGFLLVILVLIWLVVRLIKGLQKLARHEPIADPVTWWI